MGNQITLTTSGEEETQRLGNAAAKALEPGDVVLLRGNLGAGKSALARGIARGLGIEELITSPTFVIMNRYECPPPLTALHHFDLYRKPSANEFDELGFSEILLGGDSLSIVEWAENLPPGLVKNPVQIRITAPGKDANIREIQIAAGDKRASVWGDALSKSGFSI